MVVSWHTVRCRNAAPYAEAQFRIISQFALNISTMGSGFIKGTLQNGIVSSGLGYYDFLLYDKTRPIVSPFWLILSW